MQFGPIVFERPTACDLILQTFGRVKVMTSYKRLINVKYMASYKMLINADGTKDLKAWQGASRHLSWPPTIDYLKILDLVPLNLNLTEAVYITWSSSHTSTPGVSIVLFNLKLKTILFKVHHSVRFQLFFPLIWSKVKRHVSPKVKPKHLDSPLMVWWRVINR